MCLDLQIFSHVTNSVAYENTRNVDYNWSMQENSKLNWGKWVNLHPYSDYYAVLNSSTYFPLFFFNYKARKKQVDIHTYYPLETQARLQWNNVTPDLRLKCLEGATGDSLLITVQPHREFKFLAYSVLLYVSLSLSLFSLAFTHSLFCINIRCVHFYCTASFRCKVWWLTLMRPLGRKRGKFPWDAKTHCYVMFVSSLLFCKTCRFLSILASFSVQHHSILLPSTLAFMSKVTKPDVNHLQLQTILQLMNNNAEKRCNTREGIFTTIQFNINTKMCFEYIILFCTSLLHFVPLSYILYLSPIFSCKFRSDLTTYVSENLKRINKIKPHSLEYTIC